jgi:hypothetical protein
MRNDHDFRLVVLLMLFVFLLLVLVGVSVCSTPERMCIAFAAPHDRIECLQALQEVAQ